MPIARMVRDERIAADIVQRNGDGIANEIANAIAAERERCAKIADHYAQANVTGGANEGARIVAAYIRSGEL
jgi:hypothetical protein